jgi:mannose-1-phosphate guanylyltransferase/mannose-6-phosphate isomerase
MPYRIIPAIMSGGAGTRLWPLSTEDKPKQFHALVNSQTMFVETLERVRGDVGALSFAPPIVLSNAAHRALVKDGLAANGVTASAIVLEPMARNTAAVAAIAAAVAEGIDHNALVLLMPADHLVAKPDAFRAAIECAAPFASERIIAFGITPDRPATGYGYIKCGAELTPGVFAIDSFHEKPSEAVAQSYLNEGGYAWNGGIFLFSPKVMLEEFSASADIRDTALASLERAARHGSEIHLDAETFARAPSLPLDIAVMEKTQRGGVVPCEIGWADVGSWDEIWRLSKQDENGNAHRGETAILSGSGNLLHSEGIAIYAAGIDNLIVVATPDAVIIVPRHLAQDVKALREAAKNAKR